MSAVESSINSTTSPEPVGNIKTVSSDTDEERLPLVQRKKGSRLTKTPSFPEAVDIQSDEDRAERESLAFVEMSVDEENTVPNQQTTRHLLFILYAILSMLVVSVAFCDHSVYRLSLSLSVSLCMCVCVSSFYFLPSFMWMGS